MQHSNLVEKSGGYDILAQQNLKNVWFVNDNCWITLFHCIQSFIYIMDIEYIYWQCVLLLKSVIIYVIELKFIHFSSHSYAMRVFLISYQQIILFLLTCSCEFNFCILVFENIGCICWVLRNNFFYDHFIWQFSCASLFNSFVSLKYVGTQLKIMRNDSYFC